MHILTRAKGSGPYVCTNAGTAQIYAYIVPEFNARFTVFTPSLFAKGCTRVWVLLDLFHLARLVEVHQIVHVGVPCIL